MGTTPAVVYLVIRNLGELFSKCPDSLHIFIFPKLILNFSGGSVYKVAYSVLYAPSPPSPPGAKFWPTSMHKYFFIGFVFPIITHSPWYLRGGPKFLDW